MPPQSPFECRRLNLLSIVGFMSFTGALLIANSNPATEYELSIYQATPVGFWIGVAVAFASALAISFLSKNSWYRSIGTYLGGMTSVSIVSLPIIRGYYFLGIADAHDHVGFTKRLVEGTITPFDLLYPGIHTVSAFINILTGFSVWLSVMFVPVTIVVLYFVFVPLVVREIIDRETATAVGAFAAFLLVPAHPIANSAAHTFPSSQAILFTPVAIFLLIQYLRSPYSTGRFGVFSPVGIVLLLVIFAGILYHPQQSLHVLILLVVISMIQLITSRTNSLQLTNHQKMYSITALSVLIFVGWISVHPTASNTVNTTITSVQGYLFGAPPSAGTSVSSQTGALQAIGVSLPIFYLKMFLVSTVFAALTGLMLLMAFADRLRYSEVDFDTTRIIRYFGTGLVAIFMVFFLYFFGDVAKYYFRVVGFMLMMGTIVGAVGISYGTEVLSKTQFRTGVRLVVIIGFVVMIVLSTLLIFNSPYIHRANKHVTETKVDGYESAFQMTDDAAWIAGVRQSPQTYYTSIIGMNDNGRRDGTVNSSELYHLQERRNSDWYLIITQTTHDREIRAYHEYRFTRNDLEAVKRQEEVNLVHSNGYLDMYYVS